MGSSPSVLDKTQNSWYPPPAIGGRATDRGDALPCTLPPPSFTMLFLPNEPIFHKCIDVTQDQAPRSAPIV